MTLAEFKAWFEGYTESLKGAPDENQWKRIQDRVKEIDGTVTPHTVFVDRYFKYPSQWPFISYGQAIQNLYSGVADAQLANDKLGDNNQTMVYNSANAFRSLGKTEAAN